MTTPRPAAISSSGSPSGPRRLTAAAALALVPTAVLTGLLLLVTYGLTTEYGDTGAGAATTAVGALRGGALGIALVAACATLTAVAARRSRGSRALTVAAAATVAVAVAGVPAAALLGVQAKFDRYPPTPDCTDGFTTGPAVPVVRAAQAAFEEIDHPGPFSGGGSSGVDGCSSQVMVPDGTDVAGAYRVALERAGWHVSPAAAGRLRAVKGSQAFELTGNSDEWWVWVGPATLRERPLRGGQVGPRN